MGNAKFVLNNEGFAEMANGPEMAAACLAEAERAKAIAEGLAAEITVTGEYASSFEVTLEEGVVPFGAVRAGPRVGAKLENTAPYAAAVEWGNKRQPHPHRILGRTLDALQGEEE